MSCTPSKILIWSCCLALFATGCTPQKPVYLNGGDGLSYYVDQATKVEYPDVEYPTLAEVTNAYPPMTVLDPDFDSYHDITLEQCVQFALSNSKVIRGYGTPSLQQSRVAPGQDDLVNAPTVAATTWNVAIRQTEPGFLGTPGQIANPSALTTNTALDSNQGVESALADFDAQLTSSFTFAKSNEPRNSVITSPLNSQVFDQDQWQWQTEIAKKTANGTQLFFRNINQYTSNNNPLANTPQNGLQVLDSFYRASFEAEVRQPLLRGRGAFINRMPIVVSRINTDQEISNVEATLQNLVTNVEIRYWDLYCAYRSFESAKTGRDAAIETWRIVKDQFDEGAEVNIQQVAQASEQVHFFEADLATRLNEIQNAEGQLRYLLGWAITDGKFLRPIDEPLMAPIEFDWHTTLCEALTYRPELRQERWEIKKRELGVHFAKNGLLPTLDLSLTYRWLGLGNRFGTSDTSTDFPDATTGALNELFGGGFQEIQVGGSFGMPIGFRREEANVRNAQLKLARELARAEDMELDLSKQLAETFRALAHNQYIMQQHFNRWKATTEERDHFDRLEDAGTATLDQALDSQRRQSQAEVAFYSALCEYNKLIALMHRRKGTILPYSGIAFAEGPWPGKAYLDAAGHAERRGASRQLDYGWSRPSVISRGENLPTANNTGQSIMGNAKAATQVINTGIAPVSDPYGNLPIEGIPADDYIPMEGGIIDGAIPLQGPNTTPFAPGGSVPRVPTPATRGSSSRNHQPKTAYNVQQVAYAQDIPLEDIPEVGSEPIPKPTATNSKSKPSYQPVAVRKVPKIVAKPTRTRAVKSNKPKRDNTPMPAKRLRATTGVNNASATPSKPNKVSKNTTPAVLHTGNMAWEKMGLNRPESVPPRTTAKIKIN